MNHLEHIFQIWDVLYDKNRDTKSTIEEFFHDNYTQCINGVIMNRDEYISHVVEQKRNLKKMEFKCKNHLSQAEELFIIYYAKGQNIQNQSIEAEVIAYFQFKDNKVFKIHGQVHLMQGKPSDVDMHK